MQKNDKLILFDSRTNTKNELGYIIKIDNFGHEEETYLSRYPDSKTEVTRKTTTTKTTNYGYTLKILHKEYLGQKEV